MVAAAVVGAGVIGAGASVASAQSASSAQEKAANKAIGEQQGFFNTEQQNLQPFIQTGTGAANKISDLEGLNGGPSNIQQTLQTLPGYQFANYQGLKSVQNQATERGLGLSGAAIKGAASYSTGLANENYNNYLTGLQTTENTGANAAAGLANNATQTGANIGQTTVGAGNAAAAGDLATGAGIANAANSVPSALITQNLLSQIQGGGASGIFGTTNALSNSPVSWDAGQDLSGLDNFA